MERKQLENFSERVDELIEIFNNLCELRKSGGAYEVYRNSDLSEDEINEKYYAICEDCIFSTDYTNCCVVEDYDIFFLQRILDSRI